MYTIDIKNDKVVVKYCRNRVVTTLSDSMTKLYSETEGFEASVLEVPINPML